MTVLALLGLSPILAGGLCLWHGSRVRWWVYEETRVSMSYAEIEEAFGWLPVKKPRVPPVPSRENPLRSDKAWQVHLSQLFGPPKYQPVPTSASAARFMGFKKGEPTAYGLTDIFPHGPCTTPMVSWAEDKARDGIILYCHACDRQQFRSMNHL